MTEIKTVKQTRLDPILERLVSKHIADTLSRKTATRCQVKCENPTRVLIGVDDVLSDQAECLFVQLDDGKSIVTSIACSKDAFEIVKGVAESQGVVSFVFDKGAITASFDTSLDGGLAELHLVCWGVMREYAEKISLENNGIIY
ncbi:MAG: hypothetical protein Q8L66_00085 [Caulobacter sp.]|nr:hypothetical protein [Caulobacter sp.]